MYSLQVFDIDRDGTPAGVIHVGGPFETVSAAANVAWRLAVATNYRVTDEGGHVVCEDRVPQEFRDKRAFSRLSTISGRINWAATRH
jgi:hypothetical protein